MDVTNRTVIVGGALIGIFLVFLVILLAWSAPDQSIERLGDLSGYLDDHNSTGAKLIVTFGGLILVLLAALVIIFEVAPPETSSVRVARVGGGQARIASDEVSQRLEEELRAVPQLNGVQATVQPRGNRAGVALDLSVSADADLAATTDDALRRTRELMEGRMGIEIEGQPQANIHYRELRVARPAVPPAAKPATPTFGNEPAHEPTEQREEAPPAGA